MNTANAQNTLALAACQKENVLLARIRFIVEVIGKTIAVGIIIASLWLFLWAVKPSEGMTQGNYYASPSPQALAKAHLKHGILASERNLDGEWGFWRRGEWCKLFPKGEVK